MNFLKGLIHNYNEVDLLSDERTRGWLMVDSFWKMMAVVATYYCSIWLGVRFMKNRKPFKLKKIALIYNISAVLLNAYIVVESFISATGLKYSFMCNGITRNNRDPLEMRMASVTWLFYMVKYFELLDTMFIVLKKKERNLNFLHIYHHSTVVMFCWSAIKWFPTSDTYIAMIIINPSVHVIMYLYYGLSCLGPKVAKYLWWKKYLTILQLVQFGIAVSLMCIAVPLDCSIHPRWYSMIQLVYEAFYLVLFGKFYVQSYKSKKHKKL